MLHGTCLDSKVAYSIYQLHRKWYVMLHALEYVSGRILQSHKQSSKEDCCTNTGSGVWSYIILCFYWLGKGMTTSVEMLKWSRMTARPGVSPWGWD